MFPMTPWVKRLLWANVLVAAATGVLVGPILGSFGDLLYYLMVLVPREVLYRPWTLITYTFLHAGWGHLFFNMLSLFFFGPRLESRLGSRGFLQLYFLSGLGGGVFSLLFARDAAVVGASGAVYGVLLGFAMFWPRERIYIYGVIPVEAWLLVGLFVLVSLFSGISASAGSSVAHFAHLGGFAFAFGYLKWWDWRKGAAKRAFQRQMKVDVHPSGLGGDRTVLARWRGIPVSGLHELNRGEVERLIAKAEAHGPASLTRSERDFLDRMSTR